MSTHKRQQRCSQPPSQYILPRLPPLVSKSRCHLVSPVQHRVQLVHQNIRSEDTEAPTTQTANVELQHQRLRNHISIPAVPSSHDFTSPSLRLQLPHSTVSSPKQKQSRSVVVDPCTNMYSDRVQAYGSFGFPGFSRGNLVSGMDTRESATLSTEHLLYSDLQLQETIQNQQSQNYWIPILHAPEDVVWAAMAQPTLGVHQDQSSQFTMDQHPPISTQQIPPIQPAYHVPLQQNSQYVACVKCPSAWRSHLEGIMLSHLENKGISDLRCNYRDLRQHIDEAHRWEYGVACVSCENFFCYHLETMMLLEGASGDLSKVRIDLRSSCKALRDHIKETHGGC